MKSLKYLYITLLIVFILVLLVILYYFLVAKKRGGSVFKSKTPVKSILFIGDSNTAANFSYADQLRAARPGLSIKKVAQNAAKTDWMLSQLNTELNSSTNSTNLKYDAVIILAGSNDIYATGSIGAAKTNLDTMYRLAKSKGMRVVAVSPPNKDFYVNKTEPKQVVLRELVGWIKKNPNKDHFIDFWAMTANQNLFSSGDGYLHPQRGAHTLLMKNLINTLNL